MFQYSRCLVFALLLVISGCAYGKYFPKPGDQFLTHPFGMDIYNKSGIDFGTKDWERIFPVVGDAYIDLLGCVGKIGWPVEEGIKNTSIIILPPEPIEGKPVTVGAFVYPGFLFVREDFFYISLIRHEWLHVYLFLSGERSGGDPEHKDLIFTRCPVAPGY